MSAVEELETLLQSLQALKPPGVTKSKIEAITNLCSVNIQSESLIVQKIFTHFKKTASTHKLGILYVVDSVTRQWVEKARQAGQSLSGGATADGTFAAGIHKMTELLPLLMNDLIQTSPPDQKEKIKKLIDIWERGNTFPLQMLSEFRQKLSSQPNARSFTPPGSPKAGLTPAVSSSLQPQPPAAQKTTPANVGAGQSGAGAILAALASMGKQNTSTPAPAPFGAQDNSAAMQAVQPMPQAQVVPPIVSQVSSVPNYALSVNAPAAPVNPMPQMPAMATPLLAQGLPMANPINPLAAFAAQPTQTVPGAPDTLALQVQLLQSLTSGQIPADQIGNVLAALGIPQPPQGGQQPTSQIPGSNGDYQSRDRDSRTGPHDGSRYRDRSLSPDSRYRRASPPHRRDSPTYGSYDPSSSASGGSYGQDRRGRGRGRGYRNDYRQRSPLSAERGRPQSPGAANRSMKPKYIDYDPNLPPGSIKVLSRTLFVGGATGTEQELRAMFSNFGEVQSCIVNHEKRHAFVKMVDRKGAVAAKSGMEQVHDPEILSKARSTRWGVGFGPRECSDYNIGVSVIPIDCLTDADRKWMVSAEYGGTGGKPIEPGLVVEEPDIEIGAGVSSKAISRRIGPDQGSRRGGHGFNPRGGSDSAQRFRRPEGRPDSPRNESNPVGVAPAVPGFGFHLPGMARPQYG